MFEILISLFKRLLQGENLDILAYIMKLDNSYESAKA